MKDSIRVIVTNECNLSCAYCCNNIPEINEKFKSSTLDELPLDEYNNLCITGGEPLLNFDTVLEVLNKWFAKSIRPAYLYTNGLLYDPDKHHEFMTLFTRINIGIHDVNSVEDLHYHFNSSIVRFAYAEHNADGIEEKLSIWFPKASYKSFRLNECDMPNEDWYILK